MAAHVVLENVVKPAEVLYGRIVRVWVLIFPFFAIMDPEDLQIVLSSGKHTEKSFFYKLLHNFLGNGLITSSGKRVNRFFQECDKNYRFEKIFVVAHSLWCEQLKSGVCTVA